MMYQTKSEESKIFDFIVNNGIATEDETQLVTAVAGWSVETLNAVIYARTGYHDAPQCLACEPENFVDLCKDFAEDDDDNDESDC